ncbi:unnamed protein product [Hymenolepis diminuta]|uniref:Uncharacterized protein n=1 Tax=Hymenolepis diminuta TaxID=6216 RepID=A0A564Z1P6_HYMDI|nr:unnamed protein product [Hymenolepis diminuta]
MRNHDGCDICKILYRSELVAVQHMLGVKHHKRYECVQKEAGKPISHFCPVCGVGNIPDLNLWVVHTRSALHKKNYDQYMQIFYAQRKVLKQSKAANASKNLQPKSDKKVSTRSVLHREPALRSDQVHPVKRRRFHEYDPLRDKSQLPQETSQFPPRALFENEPKSHDNEDHSLDQPRQSVSADDVRDIPVITCSRPSNRNRDVIETRGGTSRHHPDPRYFPQPSSFDTGHPPLLYDNRTSPIRRLPPSLFYSSGEPFYTLERRGGDRFGPPANRNLDEATPMYLKKPLFDSRLQGQQNDRYHYVRPSTPDTRSVFDYRHMRHYSEEPILPSETARSRRPEGYCRSTPHHHVDQASHYSSGPRRRGSGTRSHHSSRPSTSHGNRSPDSHRHQIGVTHSHSHRHTSHDNRERSSRSNRSCVRRSISQDSSRRKSQHCNAPESPSQKGVTLEESKPTQRSNNEEGRDTDELPCEAEVIQLEYEPEILDEVEATGSTMDPNPENSTIETSEVVEQEPEPQQEVQNGNSEMETEEAEESFPSKKRRKKSQEQRRSKKEKESQSVDTSQLEQDKEDGEQNQSTSVLFSPSDRHLAFMTTVQKTHEVSKLSDEIEELNEHQAKLTYYIRQLKFIRSQNKEEKRQLRRRRSVLLAEMNQSDSQAETGSSDEFDDSTPPHIESEGVTSNQIPVAACRETPAINPEPMGEVETAKILGADESKQITMDNSGRLIITIEDEEDEVVEHYQCVPPSKRARAESTAESQIESAEQQLISTEMPKRKRRRGDILTQETPATPQSSKRKRSSKKATEASENVPPADQTEKDPAIHTPVNNTILLQTFGEAPIGVSKQKPEEPAVDAVSDPPVGGSSRVNQKRLRFVRGLLSHPKCKDYTFEELDRLISDYSKDKLLQAQKFKKNQV